jgi:hypothetical protein
MKTKLLLTVVLGLQAVFALAQNDTTVIIRNGIGLTVSPLFSVNEDRATYYNVMQGRITGSAGITGTFVINKKYNISLSAELGYKQNSWLLKDLPNTTSLIDSEGNIHYDRITYFEQIEKLNYIYFSTSVNKIIYKFSKKFFLLGGAGIQAGYFYSEIKESKNCTDYFGNNNNFKYSYSGTDINQHYTAALLGRVGVQKNFLDKFSLMVTPCFSYELIPVSLYLNSTTHASDEKIKFYNTGINFQLLYNF